MTASITCNYRSPWRGDRPGGPGPEGHLSGGGVLTRQAQLGKDSVSLTRRALSPARPCDAVQRPAPQRLRATTGVQLAGVSSPNVHAWRTRRSVHTLRGEGPGLWARHLGGRAGRCGELAGV